MDATSDFDPDRSLNKTLNRAAEVWKGSRRNNGPSMSSFPRKHCVTYSVGVSAPTGDARSDRLSTSSKYDFSRNRDAAGERFRSQARRGNLFSGALGIRTSGETVPVLNYSVLAASSKLKNSENFQKWRDFLAFQATADVSVGGVGALRSSHSDAPDFNTCLPFSSSVHAATNIVHRRSMQNIYCRSIGCSNACGVMSDYPAHLQEKVARGIFLGPTHCRQCLDKRALCVAMTAKPVAHTVLSSAHEAGVSGLASGPPSSATAAPWPLLFSRVAVLEATLQTLASAAAESTDFKRRRLASSPDFDERHAAGLLVSPSPARVYSSPSCMGVVTGAVPSGFHFCFETCSGCTCGCGSADLSSDSFNYCTVTVQLAPICGFASPVMSVI